MRNWSADITAVMSALEELYRRNLGLIRRIARETAREFNCLHMDRERPGELSGYTKTILEDLCGEGALEFLTRVQSREYDESRAVLATYLYPHLKGRMTRWLEQHIGNLSLSKHEMDAVRQAQRLYHSGQFSIEEIAEKMDVLLEQAVKHIRYNTHFVGVNDLIPGSYDGDPFERLIPGNLSVSAEQVVYRKVCIELLQELFDALPKKDRDILGKFYGVFGFEKTSLKEIGMYHMMKESAVEKAKVQVSRQTPILSLSSTLSIIALSSSKLLPISVPFPAIVSSKTVVVISGKRTLLRASAIKSIPTSAPCPVCEPGWKL